MSPEQVLDNRLALSQMVQAFERTRTSWALFHDPAKHTPEFRYELRVHDGPLRGIYRGRTASHAASAAQEAMRFAPTGGAAQ